LRYKGQVVKATERKSKNRFMRMPPSKVDRFTSNQDISPAEMLRFGDIFL